MVKGRWIQGAAVVALVATLAGSTAGWGQPGRNGTVADPLASLRVGHWVQLEGTARGTSPVTCTEVRPLAGDFLDDDYSLKGLVKTVNAARREFSIGGSRIRVTGGTTYDNPKGTFKGFMDLRPGMVVEVEGAFLQDRALLAVEVDDESDEIAWNPGVRDEIEIVGKVEGIDPRRRVVKVMGIEFQISGRTKLLSAIH